MNYSIRCKNISIKPNDYGLVVELEPHLSEAFSIAEDLIHSVIENFGDDEFAEYWNRVIDSNYALVKIQPINTEKLI